MERVRFGAMTPGGDAGGRTALGLLDTAVERGVDVIDPANMCNNGASETIIGGRSAPRGCNNPLLLL